MTLWDALAEATALYESSDGSKQYWKGYKECLEMILGLLKWTK